MSKLTDFVKKYKKQIIGGAAVLLILVWAFWYGGNAPDARGFKPGIKDQGCTTEYTSGETQYGVTAETTHITTTEKTEQTFLDKTDAQQNGTETEAYLEDKSTDTSSDTEFPESHIQNEDRQDNTVEDITATEDAEITEGRVTTEHVSITRDTDTTKSAKTTEAGSTTESGQTTIDPGKDNSTTETGSDTQQASEQVKEEFTCTISIDCANILNNMEYLADGKESLVPTDGVILSTVTVGFKEGDTVFDVLKKVCDTYYIHLQYKWTPVYGSYYINGINNLYEFDCGNLSGWMYSVNGWFPNYGCSQYELADGDDIRWTFTCDLGADVGSRME